MNSADFFTWLFVLAGTINAFGVAHAHKAGTIGIVLFVMGGLLGGFGLGVLCSWLTQSAFKSRRLSGAMQMLLYLFIPSIGFAVVICVPPLVAMTIYR